MAKKTNDEAARLLAKNGMVNLDSATKALPVLLHGKHKRWAVIGCTDEVHKAISEPDSQGRREEVDSRTRTLTIKLVESR